MSIRTSRDVAAPAARVHDLLTDVDAWSLWSPHVVSVRPLGGSSPDRVTAGWRAEVRPFFGPATTMTVSTVRPDGGYTWASKALGHRLEYDLVVTRTGADACELTLSAHVRGPLGGVLERVVGRLSAFGQRRRAGRIAVLAEGWQRLT